MMTSVSFVVREALLERGHPVVTAYEMFRLVWDVYTNSDKYPVKFRRKVKSPGYDQYRRVIMELSKDRFVRADDDFGESGPKVSTRVFRVSDIPDASAEGIICLVDPFAYISHLSAMQHYGLTVRQPDKLAVSTPGTATWNKLANHKILAELGFVPDYTQIDFFRPLSHLAPPERIRRRQIEWHRPSKPSPSIRVYGEFSRIIEIGFLFVQMLDDPSLCGGIHHVIDTWKEHAEVYIEPVISAVEASSSAITKVRAGYILSELMELSDERVEAWAALAQRGGSRKLDSTQPYVPLFSEKWMISLNAGY